MIKKEQCELYLDHQITWGGDGFYCVNCMLEFVPGTTREERIKQGKLHD